ncbi:hypothetical protein J2X16_005175, partial [Pelomonas aquatica]|nr:hypothetical protein [Pelomonas aquatica]
MWTRRAFPAILAGTAAGSLSIARASTPACAPGSHEFGHGLEGQRKADLGNGTYLNPIVAGDHADPTV